MKNKGISLIVLVITILTLAILATVVMVTLSNQNIFSNARKAVFSSDVSNIKEELYVVEKSNKLLGEDYSYVIPDDLQDKFSITLDRELAYIGTNEEEKAWATEMGLEVISKEKLEFREALFTLKKAVDEENKKAEANRDYSDLVSSSLSDKMKVYDDGEIVYNGDVTAQEAKWAREYGYTVIDDAGHILIQDVRNLRDLAVTYVNNNNKTITPNEYSLQYIRKDTYNDVTWTLFAGVVDTSFVSFVNSNNSIAFTGKKLLDTVTGKNIDFVHEMASLNGYIQNADSPIPAFKEYGGWAGDLCTLINEVHAYNTAGDKTTEELTEYAKLLLASDTVISSFSLADMLADVDAINIYNSLEETSDLPEAIYSYYYGDNYNSCENRFTLFLEHLYGLRDSGDETLALSLIIKTYAGAGSDAWISYASQCNRFADVILDDGVTSAEKKLVSEVFVEYILNKVEEENN